MILDATNISCLKLFLPNLSGFHIGSHFDSLIIASLKITVKTLLKTSGQEASNCLNVDLFVGLLLYSILEPMFLLLYLQVQVRDWI